MTDDVLDRLRSSNPVPRDAVPAPPMETIIARLQSNEPERRSGFRLRGLVVPALGVAATLAVAVIALSLVGHRDRTTTSVPAHSLLPTPTLAMPGVVQVDGAAFPSEGAGTISIEQCFPCRAPSAQVNRTWTVVAGGEGSWHLHRTPSMGSPEFSGEVAGWAIGTSFARNGGIVSSPYVTHDGARTWTRVSLPPGASNATVSVAGATAWATASTDPRHVIVLNGPARGSTLALVARLQFSSAAAASIVAGDDATAYLEVVQKLSTRHLVTHDAGQTWQRLLLPGCTNGPDSTLSVDSASSLWSVCSGPAVTVAHSTDGGRTWRTFHVTAPGRPIGAPLLLRAASPSTAWMLSNHGDVMRITDGGARSQRVWSVTRSQQTAVGGRPEALTVISENKAYLTVLIPPVKHGHTHGTYLVVYKTHDGGQTWQPQVVTLTHR